MPLASHFPLIDDRKFEDIVAEAKARIPRYTPEWTDFNPGDPGLALIELFAWMTELLAFRMNQVPKLNYLKFLQLIGIDLRPALPAMTILVYPLLPSFAATSTIVPRLAQVATAEPDEQGRPIVFETERTMTALRARLDAVQSYNGYNYALASEANAALAPGFAPFGPLANPGSALMLGFDDPGELPADAELALSFWPHSPVKDPPPSPCGGFDTAVPSPAKIVWEAWSGTEWRPVNVALDETLGFTRSGIVLLRTPAKGQAVKAKLGAAVDKPRYWLRARLDRASYQFPPKLLGVRANAVRAIEAQTARDEVLGGSDATPDQVLRTSNAPLIPGSLTVEVYESDRPEVWQAADDFFGQMADAAVYVANWATGEIRFAGVNAPGSGKGGRIPVASVSRPQTNIVAREYRFGGGIRGNVPAGAISAPLTAIAGVDAAGVSNPFASVGGSDEEDIATAMDRAPRVLKARDRAVTPGDFELLAMEPGSVARAKALPLSHPDFPGIDVPGVVTLVVIPEILGTPDQQLLVPAPRPSETLQRTVCAYLDARRMLTTELYVIGPVYVSVSLSFTAVIESGTDAAQMSVAVETATRRFFHPLYGGNGGTGWAFGGDIRYGELYRALLVPGVVRIDDITVMRDGQPFGSCTDVPILANALIELTGVEVTVSEAAAEAA